MRTGHPLRIDSS